MKKSLWLALLAGVLAACGGSDDEAPPPVAPSKPLRSGILTDGPVTGATYTINGQTFHTGQAREGSAAAQPGEFFYRDGEMLSFFAAGVPLGAAVAGSSRLSPAELTNDPNTLANMLVFLQSLDRDGDHSNGIEIDPVFEDAFAPGQLNWSQSPADFVQNSHFADVLRKLGKQPVVPAQALANFQATFYQDIAGVWLLGDTATEGGEETGIFYFDDKGGYWQIEGQTDPNSSYVSGIETGTLGWSPLTALTAPTIALDTNGHFGLSNPRQGVAFKLRLDGSQLQFYQDDPEVPEPEVGILRRMTQNTATLEGAWRAPNGQMLMFLPNNAYAMIDPVGDTRPNSCGGPGMEYGTYTASASTLQASDMRHDTNGCAGLHDARTNPSPSYTFSREGSTLTLDGAIYTRVTP